MKRTAITAVLLLALSALYSQEAANTWVNTLKERIKLAGYIQAGYTYDDQEEADNNFDIKRIIFMAEGKITDNWSCYFMYNFNGGGTLLEAYTDYHFLPGLSARMGQFKMPLTLEGPLSPSSVELIECYSQATNYYTAMGGSHDLLRGSTAGRDLGVMLYGDLLAKHLTYHLAIVNGQGINTRDKNSNKDVVGSLMVNPINWLSVGGSFATGKGVAVGTSEVNPDIQIGDNYRRNRYAISTNIKTKPVTFRAEYIAGKDGKVKSDGYYGTAAFHVLPKFDIIASYDYLNKNKDLKMKQTNYVAGVQYWFYPRCRVQAQYTYKDNHITGSSNMFQAQVQVRF
ncbi:OprO/OprP family phosphate-selective porin [Bacteroides sp. OttesenSCG-928-N06]|nr:OprO/OprP family phosphate-selective porin [Bacteroides sp. OttesenSCG-928-N06]